MPTDSPGSAESLAAGAAVHDAIRDVRPQWTVGPTLEPGVHDPAGTLTPAQVQIAKRLADHGASITAMPSADGTGQPTATIRWDGDLHETPVVFEELAADSPPRAIAQRVRDAGQALGGRRGEVVFFTPPPGIPAYVAQLGYHLAVAGGERAADEVHFVNGREVFSLPYEVATVAPRRLADDAFAEGEDLG